MALPPVLVGAFQVAVAAVPVMVETVGAVGAPGVVPALTVTFSEAEVEAWWAAEPE
jgi:hypothetical protein